MDVAGARPGGVDDDVAGDAADHRDVRTHVLDVAERSEMDPRRLGAALGVEAAGSERRAPRVEAVTEDVEGVDEETVQLRGRHAVESLQPGMEVAPRADVFAELGWRGGDDLGDGEVSGDPLDGAVDQPQRRGRAACRGVDVDELGLEDDASLQTASDEVETAGDVAHRHEGGVAQEGLEHGGGWREPSAAG